MAAGKTSNSSGQDRESQKVIQNALKMAFGTMTSRILGLLREMALASMFNRSVTDAWAAAFRLPNLFRRLLGEGSMSVSFIPVFIEARIKDGESEATDDLDNNRSKNRAKNLVNGFYTLLLLILSVLTVLGTIYSEPILSVLLDPDYIANAEKMALTVRLAKIMFSFIFLISTYAYFMGILNALGYYALPAMAPTLWNISLLLFTFIPPQLFPSQGDGLAWGVVVGGALQAGILIPTLIRSGYFPKISWNHFLNADVHKVLLNMVPGLVGTGLLQITTVVNLRFASHLQEGSISYVYWADRLLELPLSLVSVSLGSALLPTLTEMWSRGERERMSQTANYYLRLNLFVAWPAALGLYFLSLPLVEIMFQRGKFGALDAARTAEVLKVYSFLLISSSCVRVLVPIYYAVKNTWFPAVASGFSLFAHILIAPVLMEKFNLIGLVLSSLMSATLNMLILMGGLNIFVTTFNLKQIVNQLIKFIPGGVVMALVIQFYFFSISSSDSLFTKIVAVGFIIFLSILSYFVMSYLLKLEEHQTTVSIFIKKVKKKFISG